MISIYAFYVDVFWLNCFLMNYAVLLLAGHAQKLQGKKLWLKSALASLAGSVGSVIVLLLMHSYLLFQMINILIIIPVMVRIAFHSGKWQEWIKRILLCYGITVLLGGITTALDYGTGIPKIPFMGGLVGVLLGELLLRYLYGMIRLQRHLFPLEILLGEKKETCTGLLDTGNLLRVPGSGEPVHIVSDAIIKSLGLTTCDAAGIVGYQALGTSDGMLFIYRVDGIRELTEPTAEKIQSQPAPAVIAGADEKMFARKSYQVILHSDFEERVKT